MQTFPISLLLFTWSEDHNLLFSPFFQRSCSALLLRSKMPRLGKIVIDWQNNKLAPRETHFFVNFFGIPALHDNDVKATWNCLISLFIENVNKRRRISLSLFELEYFSYVKFKFSLTWDQALFSFRFENYIPAGQAVAVRENHVWEPLKLGLISG